MEISALLSGLLNFALYFALSIIYLIIFKIAYTKITPQDEFKLIREEKNIAAAIGLGGAIIGFAIALASAASNSVSLIDFAVWAIVALIAQMLAFFIIRFVFMPKIVERIAQQEISAGVVLGATSAAVGLLNAACMTY